MRILVLSQYFWPENFRINDLVKGLKEEGHEVTVLTAKPNYPKGRFFASYSFLGRSLDDYEGVKVLRVPIIPRFSGKSWQLVLNYLSFVFFASVIAPFRCRKKYDVIFVYLTSPITAALPAILLKKLTKAKLFLWVQDLWPESVTALNAIKSKSAISCLEKLVSFIYNQADKILISSKSFKQSIQKYAPQKSDDVLYFPNSVEELYQPVSPDMHFKNEYKIPDGFNVMFAGNIGYAQDFPTILKAAELLKQYHAINLVIVGEGRHFDWVRQEVQKRQLNNIYLLGAHPMNKMPQFFSHADAMLMTLKNEDVFALTVPCKLQSYFACSKPVIAAIRGDGADIMQEADAGIAVNPGDASALANAIVEFESLDSNQRKQMSQSGYAYYLENFQRSMLLNRLNSWFKQSNMKCNKG